VKKAQTWSTDALVGMTLFILAALMIYYLLGPIQKSDQQQSLLQESEKLPQLLSSEQNNSQVFIEGSKIDEGKLDEASKMDYGQLKNILGVSSDFCIYFEDDQGNLVPIGANKTGLGSPLANIGGRACNESIQ